MFKKIQKTIYVWIKQYRWKEVIPLLNKKNKKLLDVGCQDLSLYKRLKKDFEVTLVDFSPKHPDVKKENVQKLSFADTSFDTVLCFQVLEHTTDPVKAIKELRRVTKTDLFISVPNEPFFTLFRFMIWEKEHLWAITPKALKHYLGKPVVEKKIFFGRYYLAKWTFKN